MRSIRFAHVLQLVAPLVFLRCVVPLSFWYLGWQILFARLFEFGFELTSCGNFLTLLVMVFGLIVWFFRHF